jgi:DNA-binding Xre family transcriptional regulator
MARARLRVKEIALEKKISQRKLSLRSGVDIRTVQRISKDPYKVVNTLTLQRLADVLEVDISQLVESVPSEEQ